MCHSIQSCYCIVKVLHTSRSDLGGGATLAGYRLLCALAGAGVDSRMIVGSRKSVDSKIREVSRPSLAGRPAFKMRRLVYFPHLVFLWGAKLARHAWVYDHCSPGTCWWNLLSFIQHRDPNATALASFDLKSREEPRLGRDR